MNTNNKGFIDLEWVVFLALVGIPGVMFFRWAMRPSPVEQQRDSQAVVDRSKCDDKANRKIIRGVVTKVQYVAVGSGHRYGDLPIWYASIKQDDGTIMSPMLSNLVSEGDRVCVQLSPSTDSCTDDVVPCP